MPIITSIWSYFTGDTTETTIDYIPQNWQTTAHMLPYVKEPSHFYIYKTDFCLNVKVFVATINHIPLNWGVRYFMHMWFIQHKHDVLENFKEWIPLNAFSESEGSFTVWRFCSLHGKYSLA